MLGSPEVDVHGKTFKELYTQEEIQAQIVDLAFKIDKDYKSSNLHLVGVLTGTFMFFSDLVKAMEIDSPISFIKASSYQGMSSSGNINFELGFPTSLSGKDVLIIDDILDTGNSYSYLFDELAMQKPASIELATLLYKPKANMSKHKPKYFGFEISNEFVIGYGLDYNHLGRSFTSIYQLKE